MTSRCRRRHGFTLVEVILVTAIFASVLIAAYQILLTTLQAEQRIKDLTVSGKTGEAILMQIRRDLQGIVYQGLGPRVFQGVDGGTGETSEDTLHFYTTAPVPRPPEEDYDWEDDVVCLGYASVGYVVRRDAQDRGSTLFRRVKWTLDPERPFEGESYTPIYDQVVGFSVRYLDRDQVWLEDWDSETRFPEEEDVLPPGTARADLSGNPITAEPIPSDPDEELPPPPLVVPMAVQVELWVQLADEDGPKVDHRNQPIIEYYSMVVPILTTESLLVEEAQPADATSEPTPAGGMGGGGGSGGAGAGGRGGGGGGGAAGTRSPGPQPRVPAAGGRGS